MIYQLADVTTANAIAIDAVTFLYRSIFLIGITSVLVTEFLGYKIEKILWKRDCFSQNHIRPRLYGIILRLSFLAYLLIAIILMIIDRNDTFLLFLLITFGGTSFLCADIYATKLTYTSTYIVYIRYKRERIISWKEVEKLCWEQTPKALGLMLLISLQNGEKITLRQSDFVGLRRLEEIYKQNQKSGDSLCEPF